MAQFFLSLQEQQQNILFMDRYENKTITGMKDITPLSGNQFTQNEN